MTGSFCGREKKTYGSSIRWICCRWFSHKVKHWQRMVGRAMIGPICIVILIDKLFRWKLLLFLRLQMSNLEGPHCVGGHDVLTNELHLNHTVAFDASFWPVHVALSSSSLNQIRNHDNDGNSLLPNHLPESVKGAWQRSLCSNECPRLHIAVNVICINVVIFFLRAGFQWNSRMVVYEERRKA